MSNQDTYISALDALLYVMDGKSPSEAIIESEKREQQKTIRTCRLPIRTNSRNISISTKEQYENMGIKVLDEYDDLFYSVELPEGWEMKPTSHSMWNEVVDDKGRKRISFFYKGAFYDRDAFSNFINRYSYSVMPFDNYKDENVGYEDRKFKPWRGYITDCGECIKKIKEITAKTDKEYLSIDDKLGNACKKYLDKHFPDWKDVNAYWNDEKEGDK